MYRDKTVQCVNHTFLKTFVICADAVELPPISGSGVVLVNGSEVTDVSVTSLVI